MTSKPKDLTAFPFTEETYTDRPGLTKAQWYAGHALPAIIAAYVEVSKDTPLHPAEYIEEHFQEIIDQAFMIGRGMEKEGER